MQQLVGVLAVSLLFFSCKKKEEAVSAEAKACQIDQGLTVNQINHQKIDSEGVSLQAGTNSVGLGVLDLVDTRRLAPINENELDFDGSERNIPHVLKYRVCDGTGTVCQEYRQSRILSGLPIYQDLMGKDVVVEYQTCVPRYNIIDLSSCPYDEWAINSGLCCENNVHNANAVHPSMDLTPQISEAIIRHNRRIDIETIDLPAQMQKMLDELAKAGIFLQTSAFELTRALLGFAAAEWIGEVDAMEMSEAFRGQDSGCTQSQADEFVYSMGTAVLAASTLATWQPRPLEYLSTLADYAMLLESLKTALEMGTDLASLVPLVRWLDRPFTAIKTLSQAPALEPLRNQSWQSFFASKGLVIPNDEKAAPSSNAALLATNGILLSGAGANVQLKLKDPASFVYLHDIVKGDYKAPPRLSHQGHEIKGLLALLKEKVVPVLPRLLTLVGLTPKDAASIQAAWAKIASDVEVLALEHLRLHKR